MQEVVEEAWDAEWLVMLDKAWDGIDRVLSGIPVGTNSIDPEMGEWPLNLAVFRGKPLLVDEWNFGWIYRLVEPEEVQLLIPRLAEITWPWFEERYHRFCKDVWPEYGEVDLEYSWEYFQELRDFYKHMADTDRCAVFTVSV